MIVNNVRPLAFLENGGEMGALMREKDWSTTVVGTPDIWPQSLRTAVNLLLNSRFPMFVWWGKDLTAFYNDAYRVIAGEKHPTMLGQSGREAWAEIWSDLVPLVDAVFDGKSTWSEDQPLYINRRGYVEEAYFTFSYSPIVDESGAISGLFCACIETTEKVLGARKIQHSESNLRATILQSPVAMCILRSPQFVVEIANERMYELWGRPADELLHRPIFDGLPEARHQGFEELLNGVYTTGVPFTASERAVQLPRNGKMETLYLNFVYEPFREADGTITGVLAVATDVTEQVVSRRRIEESEERFRNLADGSPMFVFIIDADPLAPVSYWNRTWLQYTGQTYEEAMGRAWDGTIHPDDIPIVMEHYAPAFQNQHSYYIPAVRVKRHDGEYRWHAFKGNPRYTVSGAFDGYIGVGFDVHEQKVAEEALKESEARAKAAIEIARLGTFEIDVQQQTIIHSPRSAEILGLDPTKQWPYQTIINSVHPDDRAIRHQALEEAKRTGILFYEARVIHPDGTIRWVRLNGRYIQQGNQPRIVGTLMDISEEKKAAEVLEQKVEARTKELEHANEALVRSNQELARSNAYLEDFAHAASHDMKEPIRKVLTFSDRLRTSLESRMTDTERKLFDRVETATQRMGLLIDDLLEFSHVSERPLEKEEVDLELKLDRALTDLELIIEDKGAQVTVHPLPTVKGYERQLQQLLQNLIGNALKYSKQNVPPQVTICAQEVLGQEFHNKLLPEQAGQRFHHIEVRDNGIGFEPQYAERIFGMFQRLHGKAEYPGTGVGLSIARKVVENHNGYIWAEGRPGEGATFHVLLPAE